MLTHSKVSSIFYRICKTKFPADVTGLWGTEAYWASEAKMEQCSFPCLCSQAEKENFEQLLSRWLCNITRVGCSDHQLLWGWQCGQCSHTQPGSSWAWSASVQYQCAYSHLLVSSKPRSSFALVLELQIQGVFVHGTLPSQPMSHVWHELQAVCSKARGKTSGRICRCSGLFTALWQSLNTHWSHKSTQSRVPAWETACQIAAHMVVSVQRVWFIREPCVTVCEGRGEGPRSLFIPKGRCWRKLVQHVQLPTTSEKHSWKLTLPAIFCFVPRCSYFRWRHLDIHIHYVNGWRK